MTTTQAGMAGFAPKVSISPIITQSPDKTRIGPPQTIVEPSGVVWSIRSDGNVLRATSATSVPVAVNGKASEMKWGAGVVYAHSQTAPNHWFKVVSVKPNGITVTWADVGVNDPAPAVIPPPPPPPPAGSSPEGATVPSAVSITTGDGHVFTLGALFGAAEPDIRLIYRDGVQVDRGALLVYESGVVWSRYYTPTLSPQWWKFLPGAAVSVLATDVPRWTPPYAAPIFSFPNPLALAVGVPTSLAPYVVLTLPVVWDVVDTPSVSVTADGKMTAKVAGNGTVTSAITDAH